MRHEPHLTMGDKPHGRIYLDEDLFRVDMHVNNCLGRSQLHRTLQVMVVVNYKKSQALLLLFLFAVSCQKGCPQMSSEEPNPVAVEIREGRYTWEMLWGGFSWGWDEQAAVWHKSTATQVVAESIQSFMHLYSALPDTRWSFRVGGLDGRHSPSSHSRFLRFYFKPERCVLQPVGPCKSRAPLQWRWCFARSRHPTVSLNQSPT